MQVKYYWTVMTNDFVIAGNSDTALKAIDSMQIACELALNKHRKILRVAINKRNANAKELVTQKTYSKPVLDYVI